MGQNKTTGGSTYGELRGDDQGGFWGSNKTPSLLARTTLYWVYTNIQDIKLPHLEEFDGPLMVNTIDVLFAKSIQRERLNNSLLVLEEVFHAIAAILEILSLSIKCCCTHCTYKVDTIITCLANVGIFGIGHFIGIRDTTCKKTEILCGAFFNLNELRLQQKSACGALYRLVL